MQNNWINWMLMLLIISPEELIYASRCAQELFLEEIAARAGKTMVADNRRLLAYKDVGVWK